MLCFSIVICLFCILYFICIFLLLLLTWRIKPDDDDDDYVHSQSITIFTKCIDGIFVWWWWWWWWLIDCFDWTTNPKELLNFWRWSVPDTGSLFHFPHRCGIENFSRFISHTLTGRFSRHSAKWLTTFTTFCHRQRSGRHPDTHRIPDHFRLTEVCTVRAQYKL